MNFRNAFYTMTLGGRHLQSPQWNDFPSALREVGDAEYFKAKLVESKAKSVMHNIVWHFVPGRQPPAREGQGQAEH